jgi:hypothetical protein
MNRYAIFFKQGDGLILEGIQNVINILNLHTKIIDGTMKIVSDKKVSCMSYKTDDYSSEDALKDFILSGKYSSMFPDIQVYEVKLL